MGIQCEISDAIALQIIKKNCWQYILLTSFQIHWDIYWLLGDNWSAAIIPAIKKLVNKRLYISSTCVTLSEKQSYPSLPISSSCRVIKATSDNKFENPRNLKIYQERTSFMCVTFSNLTYRCRFDGGNSVERTAERQSV
jgi:hypothetical protein